MELYIQHVFNVDTQEIIYAELLVREYKGIKNVKDILDYVKANNESIAFDLQVLKEALRYIEDTKVNYKIAINISPDTLRFGNIADGIVGLVNNYENKDNLVLEITEETDFNDRHIVANIQKLIDSGISIALDDFGASNTSLREIIDLDVNYIKIDKSFTENILNTDKIKRARTLTVLCAIKNIAEELNISVIVECVETEEQLEALRKLNFKYIQGYLLDKPKPLYSN